LLCHVSLYMRPETFGTALICFPAEPGLASSPSVFFFWKITFREKWQVLWSECPCCHSTNSVSTEGNSKHWPNQWLGRLRWLGNLVISAFDLRLSGREFNFQPPRLILDGWLSLGGQTTSVFHRATQANSASCSQQDRKWVLATLCWSLCGWGVKAGWLIPCVHKRVGGR